MEICMRGRVCFDPLKCHFFHSKLLLDKTTSFTSRMMKDTCQKRKVKLIFRGVCNILMA